MKIRLPDFVGETLLLALFGATTPLSAATPNQQCDERASMSGSSKSGGASDLFPEPVLVCNTRAMPGQRR